MEFSGRLESRLARVGARCHRRTLSNKESLMRSPCPLSPRNLSLLLSIAFCVVTPLAQAQEPQPSPTPAVPQASPQPSRQPGEEEARPRDPMSTPTFTGLRFRSIGPAFTSGRVIGFAVEPNNPSHYFVASASGGVWKTINDGNTWTRVFNGEGSYPIACITLDPMIHWRVGVGIATTNARRGLSYGNGLYRSDDGGK